MLEQPAFGQRLRALRTQRDLSQVALAEGVMSTGYLSRLESGARPPTRRVVEHLAGRLGVPLSAFETLEPEGEGLRYSAFAEVLAAVVSAANDAGLAEPLAEALRTAPDSDPALRWQALWLLAQIQRGAGQQEQEYDLLIELVTLSEAMESRELSARACAALSRCARTLGHSAQALEYAERAYQLAGEASLTSRAGALQALIAIEAEAGELAAARAHADELGGLTEGTPGTTYVEALWAAGTVSVRQGDYTSGAELLERALARLDSRQDLVLWLRLRLAAASLYLQVQPVPLERVHALLQEAVPAVDLIGSELHREEIRTLWVYLAVEEGRLDEAWELCTGLSGDKSLLSFRDHIRFEATRARLQISRGDREAGVRRMRELAQEADEARNVELAAEIWRALATVLV
ncbi:helix-turn-helix domain-containing protein [Micromonosporaceae bacterium Da 78-11]